MVSKRVRHDLATKKKKRENKGNFLLLSCMIVKSAQRKTCTPAHMCKTPAFTLGGEGCH